MIWYYNKKNQVKTVHFCGRMMLVIIIIYFFVQYYKVQDIQRNKNKKIKNNFKKYEKGPVDKAIILNRKIDKASK